LFLANVLDDELLKGLVPDELGKPLLLELFPPPKTEVALLDGLDPPPPNGLFDLELFPNGLVDRVLPPNALFELEFPPNGLLEILLLPEFMGLLAD
jgi:hypothetical protein